MPINSPEWQGLGMGCIFSFLSMGNQVLCVDSQGQANFSPNYDRIELISSRPIKRDRLSLR